jgi:hypothetical protein
MRAGVHLANDGNVTDEHLNLIQSIMLVKGLVRLDCDWGEIDWRRLGRHLRQDTAVVLRLFYPGPDMLKAPEFVSRSIRKLPRVLGELAPRECYIEIHNEPNHRAGIEGWGADLHFAWDFALWYARVLDGLRSAGFERLGFPGLALGQWAHQERAWARANEDNIRQSDWLGVHCYWQRPEEIEHLQLGANWRWYRRRFPHKKIIVTEAANSGCDGPMGAPSPGEQAAQYARWCRLATGGVYGVTFFILGGTGWDGFQVHPETIRALGG